MVRWVQPLDIGPRESSHRWLLGLPLRLSKEAVRQLSGRKAVWSTAIRHHSVWKEL